MPSATGGSRRRLQIVPLGNEHLDAAARLLADRHRRDRFHVPALPTQFEDVSATFPVIRNAHTREGSSGVAALVNGELVGFLLSHRLTIPPDSSIAPYYRPLSALVRYDGHATIADGAWDIYRELYAAAANEWSAERRTAHYIQLPAHSDDMIDAWASMGFGRIQGWGIRETLVHEPARTLPGLVIRRATSLDHEAVFELDAALVRHEMRAPVFMPYPAPVAEREWKDDLLDSLGDASQTFWLAELAGCPVGLLIVTPPPAHISPLLSPSGMINISAASVALDQRGSGIGGILVRHALDTAHDQGLRWCRVSWMTANLYSSRFWARRGFNSIAWRMSREVDERALRI